MDQAYLRDGIFMAVLDEDIVVLDVSTDTYASLPGASGALRLSGGQICAARALLIDLCEAGLVQDCAPVEARLPIPKAPTRRLESEVRVRCGDFLLFVRAVTMTRGMFARGELKTFLHDGGLHPSLGSDERRVAELTNAFARWLPWVPGQGACLYRAYLLRQFMRLAGQDAVWIFGVRTWPFSAHCWLQIDDAVLDDDPERVRLYTPIMAA